MCGIVGLRLKNPDLHNVLGELVAPMLDVLASRGPDSTGYGSTFGLPNPGLMPTRREREEQLEIVRKAIAELERRGCTVDGQIAATRSAGRMIAKVARVRQVRYVVMDSHPTTGVRRILEGELANVVRRRLGDAAVFELVSAQG